MVTKELFTNIILALRNQYDYDVMITKTLEKAFKADDLLIYDNSKLTESLFDILGFHFPDKADYIKKFCYELDFGRVLNPDGAIDELWEELNPKTWHDKALEDTYGKLPLDLYYAGIDPISKGSKSSTFDLNTYKKQETITVHRELDVNEIEVKDFVVISPIKKYSIEDE